MPEKAGKIVNLTLKL